MEKEEFVCEGIIPYMGTIFGLGCLVVTFVIISITCYVHEFELKIILFEKLNWHPFDNQEEPISKDYDVYLMYCQKDEHWVINTLLAGLERSGYRTCVPDRDFTVGAATAEEMAEAFEKTHRVLVVISQNFIDDVNSMSDFHHAYSHDRFSAQTRFLVFVKLREKINFRQQHEIFKRYLSTNYFVPVNARKFWSRLRYWLPPLKVDELPASTDNIEEEESSDEQSVERVDEDCNLITN